jgi:RNA polymerase sigma factor (sigma-70 family)
MAARTGPVDDDRELARRFAAHETDSMRSLYARWAGPLYAIARRVALDIGRRERRRPATTPLRPSTPAPDGPTLDQAWEAWQVRCALRDLPADERELIWLTHYVGLTQSQIADRLGLPLGTVKSRSHRAQRLLAERLAHLLARNPTVTASREPEAGGPASSGPPPLVGCLE